MHMLFATWSTALNQNLFQILIYRPSNSQFIFDISDALPSFFTVAWTVQE